MDNNITHGLWAETTPLPPTLDSFSGNESVDIVIIGGGYSGLSAALHLAEKNISTMVLEANTIGFGGAGRNVGLVNAGLWLMPEDVVKIVGQPYGDRLIEELGASPDLVYALIDQYKISCEAKRKGTLHCADSSAGLKNLQMREEQWQKRGAPVQLLSKEETDKKTGSGQFRGSLFDPRAGTLQPLAYANGLAHAAKSAGARLHIHSPVLEVNGQGQSFTVKTDKGVIKAKGVIQACQGYGEQGFQMNRKSLIPFNFFQFATAPLESSVLKTILPEGHGAWDTNLLLSSYRLDAQGRLIIGSVGRVDKLGYGLNKSWARRTLKKVFPQAASAEFTHGWYGRIAMTVDHVPRFYIYDDNYISVSFYNGRGIGPGTLFGKLMADYFIDGSKNTIPLPVKKQKKIITRGIRGLFYEAGARAYHFLQRRF